MRRDKDRQELLDMKHLQIDRSEPTPDKEFMIRLVGEMSEGNPGAITVMTEMIKKDLLSGMASIFIIDDMNIRGSQIWICYKDVCNCDIDKLMKMLADDTERQQLVDGCNEKERSETNSLKA